MPYITQQRREEMDAGSLAIYDLTPGDLNYLITTMFDEWLAANGLHYTNINTALGVLEAVKLELYRRIAAPFENEKMAQNGDVYECNLNK